VRERELDRFTSRSALKAALTATGWKRWTGAIASREKEISFDWPAIREQLRDELKAWSEASSDTTARDSQNIERLANALLTALLWTSGENGSDLVLAESTEGSLILLRETINHMIGAGRTPVARLPAARRSANKKPDVSRTADELFEAGMEQWWSGDTRSAAKTFRRVLSLDPKHGEAHNHLGIVNRSAKKLLMAEQHFRAAIASGQAHIVREGTEIVWGVLENRPYLRALANLALVLADQKKWAEAIAIHKQLLELNPGDNQGVRWLIGMEYLRVGDNASAIDAFEKCVDEEVGCAFGLALAKLFANGATAEIGEALLIGFAANRYIAPMLLGEAWEHLDAYYGSNMAEPEWAQDVVDAQADLWRAVPRGAELLRFWWTAAPVVIWRKKLDEMMLRLKALAPGSERTSLVNEWTSLQSADTVRSLVRSVDGVEKRGSTKLKQ
jgi:tetratricopeptide (TPR) repeat protein